jgi:hypothetical protein
MAGRGPAPKAADQRRRSNAPTAGEWTELQADGRRKVPTLPARGKGRGAWSPRTRAAWKSWWRDPVSGMWGEADADLVLHLADLYEEWVREPKAALASEVRQVRDSLGLTPKGRQDRRWRITKPRGPAEVVDMNQQRDAPKRSSTRRRLRAVDPVGA